MNEGLTALTAEDHAMFAKMRDWVRGMVKPEHWTKFDDDPEFKIAVLSSFFQSIAYPTEDQWTLQALGLVFGDAIAASTGTHWAIATFEGDRVPVLTLPNQDLKVGAFLAFEKRVHSKEEFEVVDLFLAFCREIENCKAFFADNR